MENGDKDRYRESQNFEIREGHPPLPRPPVHFINAILSNLSGVTIDAIHSAAILYEGDLGARAQLPLEWRAYLKFQAKKQR